MIRRALLALLALAAACVPDLPGYFQFAEIETAPDPACVRQTVESAADPGSVSVEEVKGSSIVYYTRDSGRYGVQVSPKATPPFFAHYAWADRDTPAAALRQTRDRLREVTRAVQDRCGPAGLVARVKEHCAGTHCAELEAH